jgi:chromosome segregation ATPase
MRKAYWILIIVLCVLILSSAVGYAIYWTEKGAKQKEIDKLTVEMSLLISEKRSLENELEAAKDEISRLSSELDSTSDAITKARSDFSKRELYLHLWYIQKGMRTTFILSISASFLASEVEYAELEKVIKDTYEYYSMELKRLQPTNGIEDALVARAEDLLKESSTILQDVRTTDFSLIKPRIDNLIAGYDSFEKELNSYILE